MWSDFLSQQQSCVANVVLHEANIGSSRIFIVSLIFHIPHCDRFCANEFKNGSKVKNFVWNIVPSVWRSEQGELLYSPKYFGLRKAFGQCSLQITFNASANVNSTKTPTKPCLNAKVVGSPNSKHLRESVPLVNGRQYSIPKIIKLFITNPYLIFVIFFTRAKFWRIKFTPKKTRKLRQNTQKIANFLHYYGKIHSKLTIFCVKSVKIYTGQKKLHENSRSSRDKYEVCSTGQTI